MARREFPRSVKVAVIRRATRGGIVFCEKCGAMAKRWQIDHVRPDGLLGDPTIENAQLIGECCYVEKNADDTAKIAKAKRREAAHIGAKIAPVKPIQSAGFAKSERAAKREPKASLPPRQMFESL